MKMWPSIRCFFYFFCITQLSCRDIPYLLEVKKDTPLFSRPSMRADKLAEAESGTLLMFVEKSKKGIWVKLRDSDGLEGWMPIDRTDFKEVEEARVGIEEIQKISTTEAPILNKKEKSKEEMMEEVLKAREKKEFEPFLRLAPLMRWLSDAEPASSRIGLRVDYNLGLSYLHRGGTQKPAWFAAEATFPSPMIESQSTDFTAALRYVWKAPLWGPLVYGPDIGYSVDNVSSDYRHHFSAGLSSGVVWGPMDLSLRAAYDFFSQSRSMIELQLGVSF